MSPTQTGESERNMVPFPNMAGENAGVTIDANAAEHISNALDSKSVEAAQAVVNDLATPAAELKDVVTGQEDAASLGSESTADKPEGEVQTVTGPQLEATAEAAAPQMADPAVLPGVAETGANADPTQDWKPTSEIDKTEIAGQVNLPVPTADAQPWPAAGESTPPPTPDQASPQSN